MCFGPTQRLCIVAMCWVSWGRDGGVVADSLLSLKPSRAEGGSYSAAQKASARYVVGVEVVLLLCSGMCES